MFLPDLIRVWGFPIPSGLVAGRKSGFHFFAVSSSLVWAALCTCSDLFKWHHFTWSRKPCCVLVSLSVLKKVLSRCKDRYFVVLWCILEDLVSANLCWGLKWSSVGFKQQIPASRLHAACECSSGGCPAPPRVTQYSHVNRTSGLL